MGRTQFSWIPLMGMASRKGLYTFYFLSIRSKTPKGRSKYPHILDDETGLREVTGLAKVAQP